MRTGRPRTPIGTHGAVNTRRDGGRVVAETRVRDLDGRLRQVRATGPTAASARARLLERIRERPALPSAGVLRPTSSFADLADLWLSDLELRDLAGNTKENYRTCLRLHVRPAFEHYTLAEVTTGRVEWFLAKQAKVSQSQAKQTRTLLNMLFAYALRAHRRPHPRRPSRLCAAAEGSWRRVTHPRTGPARADPVPAGRSDDHRPPRCVGVLAGHQRPTRVRSGGGADRGLRRHPARSPGPAPGRQGEQAGHHAANRPGAAGPGGLPRSALEWAVGAATGLRQSDRPARRLPDGREDRQGHRDPAAHQPPLAAACRDHQRTGRRRPAPGCADPRPGTRTRARPSTTTGPAATSTDTAFTS